MDKQEAATFSMTLNPPLLQVCVTMFDWSVYIVSAALGLQDWLHGCWDKSYGQWQEEACIQTGMERGREMEGEKIGDWKSAAVDKQQLRRKSSTNTQAAQYGS